MHAPLVKTISGTSAAEAAKPTTTNATHFDLARSHSLSSKASEAFFDAAEQLHNEIGDDDDDDSNATSVVRGQILLYIALLNCGFSM